MIWNGMKLVQVSSVDNKEAFSKWMHGQTCPFVEEELERENGDPYDWAYYWDYQRFIDKKPIID